jgi:hypothetical protein
MRNSDGFLAEILKMGCRHQKWYERFTGENPGAIVSGCFLSGGAPRQKIVRPKGCHIRFRPVFPK